MKDGYQKQGRVLENLLVEAVNTPIFHNPKEDEKTAYIPLTKYNENLRALEMRVEKLQSSYEAELKLNGDQKRLLTMYKNKFANLKFKKRPSSSSSGRSPSSSSSSSSAKPPSSSPSPSRLPPKP